MLGPPKSRRLDAPIAVSLEALVPQNNFYRHLEAKLDLSFVRGWVRELYAERGRPSIDPVVFFKLQGDLFAEQMPSDDNPLAVSGGTAQVRRSTRLKLTDPNLSFEAPGRSSLLGTFDYRGP
jgi:hypothetical protein